MGKGHGRISTNDPKTGTSVGHRNIFYTILRSIYRESTAMNTGQQILFFISILGAFNGFLLSLFLFTGKRAVSPANFFLGILLLAISTRVAQAVFLYFNPQLAKIYTQIGIAACFLIGPALYYFFRAVLEKTTAIPTAWKWSWAVLLGVLVAGTVAAVYYLPSGACNAVFVSIIYTQWMIYLAATGWLMRHTIKAFIVNPAGLPLAEKFLLLVWTGNCLIFLVYFMSLCGVVLGVCISGAIAFSLVLYLTVFFYFYRARVENILAYETGQAAKPEKRKITEGDAQVWIEKLEKVMLDKALYKDPNLKLHDLARQIPVSAHQLSQLLNDNLGKSFSTYINEYRIGEACRLITDNGRLTFEAIGYEVGYNSKSTFYTAFRKIKDTTPALYKEEVEKKITDK